MMLRLLLYQTDAKGMPTTLIGEKLSPTVPLVGNTIQIMRSGQYTFWRVEALVWNLDMDDSDNIPQVILAIKQKDLEPRYG